MGVYIKGMTLGELNDCIMAGVYIAPEDAIEVREPHGRLIDADVCKQRVYDGSRTPYKMCPTVIEAEGE